MEVKILQLHKRPSEIFDNIQDKFSVNENLSCFSIADGTTQSFRSEIWAQILCHEFQNNPTFEIDNLIEKFKESTNIFNNTNFQFSENKAISSLQKTKKKNGGTATFLGLQINDNICKVVNCGDTNLFHIKQNSIEFFPYSNRNDIDNNTFFINSELLFDENFDKKQIKFHEFVFEKDEIVILATDALSRLFLTDNKIIDEFTKISDFDQLYAFCLEKWNNRILEEDDISAIIINKKSVKKYLEILPPIDFSFPKTEVPYKILDFKTSQEMNDINKKIEELQTKISDLNDKFNSIKNNNKVYLILITVAILLGLVNLFGFYKNLKKNKPTNIVKTEILNENSNTKSINEAMDSTTQSNMPDSLSKRLK